MGSPSKDIVNKKTGARWVEMTGLSLQGVFKDRISNNPEQKKNTSPKISHLVLDVVLRNRKKYHWILLFVNVYR